MPVKMSEWWPYIQGPLDDKWGYIWGTAGVMWTKERQEALASKYRSDPDKYSDLKMGVQIGKKWIGHYVIDCSGMPYRAFYKLGIKIAHGSNSIWRNHLQCKGKLVKGMKLPKGTAIFTGQSYDSHPHMGTYDGEGYVIEAQGTQAGVVKTPITASKWTYWGLYKDLEYDFIPDGSTEDVKEDPKVGNKYPTLRQGSKGVDVETVQDILGKLGSSLVVDGIFGSGTRSAVQAFQRKYGLDPDGVVGPKTWAKLIEIFEKEVPDTVDPGTPDDDGKKHTDDLTLEEKVNILWEEYVNGGLKA